MNTQLFALVFAVLFLAQGVYTIAPWELKKIEPIERLNYIITGGTILMLYVATIPVSVEAWISPWVLVENLHLLFATAILVTYVNLLRKSAPTRSVSAARKRPTYNLQPGGNY